MKRILFLAIFITSLQVQAQTKGFYYNFSLGALRYTNTGPIVSVGLGYSFGKHILVNNIEGSDIINSNRNGTNSRRQRYWSALNLNYSYLIKSGKNSFVFPVVGIAPIVQFNSRDEKAIAANNGMMYNAGVGYKIKISKKLFITSQLSIHPMNAHFMYLANGATVVPASEYKMIIPLSFKIGISK